MAVVGFFKLACTFFLLYHVYGETQVNVTIIRSAVEKGAVCLDGSPPGYSYLEGYGSGTDKWIIYLEGGGWCENKSKCVERSKQELGSSFRFRNHYFFSGILNTDENFNPEFYNWHKAFIVYCDGSSFMSDIEQVDPATNLTFRGARIFKVMMEEMLLKGMGSAKNAILMGGSAGGLATILHCDLFRSLFPYTARVKCISDSGFFIHALDIPGVELREQRFAGVIETHDLAGSLPISCTSKMNPSLCLFPEYLVGDIKTPLYLVESIFDKWQIINNFIPAIGGDWGDCPHTNLSHCNSLELEIMKDFRDSFMKTLQKLDHLSSRGMFIHSCYRHENLLDNQGWTCSSIAGNTLLSDKTIGQAVTDWYLGETSIPMIDTQNEFPRDCFNPLPSPKFNEECLAILSHNGSKTHI